MDNPDVVEANHMQPLYRLESKVYVKSTVKEVEFTGYKNRQCIEDFKAANIPFDGSHWLVKVETGWDAWKVFNDFLRVAFGDSKDIYHHFTDVGDYRLSGRDARGNVTDKWHVVSSEGMNKIRSLAHIYGAQKYVKCSKIVNGREAMGNYGVVNRWLPGGLEFVCPRCIDTHITKAFYVSLDSSQDFDNCKDIVVIDPFGFGSTFSSPETPTWSEIIAAAAAKVATK